MDGKQIRDVTVEGLVYLTENGDEVFVDFSICHANYIRKHTSPEFIERMKELNPQNQWDAEGIAKYSEDVIEWKEIGMRNVLGPPWSDGPYIEFHTEPPIRFDFTDVAQYGKVRHLIERFGWHLMDLS